MTPLPLYRAALCSILMLMATVSGAAQTAPDADIAKMPLTDSLLDSLISVADANNYDLRAAMTRIRSARNTLAGGRSSLYPTLDLSAGWTASQASGKTTHVHAETKVVDYFSVGANMSWEIDLFGRVNAQLRSDRAQVTASAADYDGARLSMAANLAKSYIQLRLAQAQLEVLKSEEETDAKILHITEVRKETGLSSALDVAQARTVLLTTRAAIPEYEQNIRTAINSIAVLMGTHPQDVRALLEAPREMPQCADIPAAGISADLLRRRPDLLQAEAQIESAAAAVGIAKKDWLPVLTLNGSVGTSSSRFDGLFSGGSFAWQVAPQISWTVFDGMARKYRDADARLNLEYYVDNYNSTLLTAWSEAENALAQYATADGQIKAYEALLDEAQTSLNLALDLYKQGLSDYSNVMNSQLSLLSARSSWLGAKAAKADAAVAIYQAMGGSWSEAANNTVNN